METSQFFVVGNWKANPKTLKQAHSLFLDVHERIGMPPERLSIAVAPPAPYLAPLSELAADGRIALAAQDVYFEEDGSHTGEVTPSMLKSVGASMVIIGHSERRARGETNEEVARDLAAACKEKLTPILCVGETERDRSGEYFSDVEEQLTVAISALPKATRSELMIAYEPVWAIGTGNDASPEEINEMVLFIQKVLTDTLTRDAAKQIPILYGGSVKKINAESLITETPVRGFLIGGASIRPAEFAAIVHAATIHAI